MHRRRLDRLLEPADFNPRQLALQWTQSYTGQPWARPGHLPTAAYALPFRWMPGTRPDMTIKLSLNYLNESEH
jgi:hypothetical protein